MDLKRFLYLVVATVLVGGVYGVVAANEPEGAEYPDPNRWSETIQKFREWDNKNSFPSDAVLFVGSSSIVGWETARAFPEYPVINRGFGGSYMADSVFYFNDVVLKYKPKVVVIFAGTNDIAGKIPAASVHRDFVRLVELIHAALPTTEIIYMPITPTASRWHLWSTVQEVNALNKDFAAGKEFVTFMDVASAFLGADGQPNAELFKDDRLHLNEKGYEKWNSALAPVLRQRYQRAMDKAAAQKKDSQG